MKSDESCLFCHVDKSLMIISKPLAYAMRDGFPVTPLHTLIIPRRHVASFFELTEDELSACHELLLLLKNEISQEDPSVEGFNIGVNVGQSAGQSVFHCHIHLIPRRTGDVENPKGGVRHLIPGKGFY